MIDLAKFSERLKEYMDERGLNGAALAREVNANRTSVAEFIRGEHLPSTQNFLAMLDYFNCSADYILGLSEVPSRTEFLQMPPFGKRLREVIEFFGSSQYRIEKDLKLSGSIVYNWLFGKSLPSVESLEKLASYFECSIDFLLGRES
ncbi:MAG: helix-turn-helix domain-containing protein [Clostridia bacterium]|nr:helix-turn-helix domain-containing protein [Clostridia bacterium]